MDVSEAVDKVRNGDTNAFKMIYDEYCKMIASVLRKVGRCPKSEMDFHLNEVFFRIYKGIFNFKGNSKFSTYVYRIALNYSFQLSKKIKKDLQYLKELDEETDSKKEHFEDKIINSFFVEKVLDSLTIKLRSVVVLFYFDELPIKEIAEAENISQNAVKNRLFQAREKIKSLMEENNYDL